MEFCPDGRQTDRNSILSISRLNERFGLSPQSKTFNNDLPLVEPSAIASYSSIAPQGYSWIDTGCRSSGNERRQQCDKNQEAGYADKSCWIMWAHMEQQA
jgi:hypothetical protein